MSDGNHAGIGLSEPITDGQWAGWRKWLGDEPFEDLVGPFYVRQEADGSMVCGARVEERNLRSGGICHGGALMTFADYSLFLIPHNVIGNQNGVTISMSSEFLAAAPAGALLTARGEVLRKGGSLVFVHGVVRADETPVLSFTGIIKLLKPR